MSTGVSSSEGVFGTFPYEVVITPATIAGLVVAFAQYLLSVALDQSSLSVEAIVGTLIGAIGTIGVLVAVLAIVVSGARSDVLAVGAILTYVAGLISTLLSGIYLGVSPEIGTTLLLSPLAPVILVVGIGIGVNWIGVDVSLLD